MPKVAADKITFIPMDRQAVGEQSPGITPAGYTALFNDAILQGDTTKYFKFLEEITEKDPDILHAVSTRSSYVSSKEWAIEGDATDAKAVEEALRAIKGDPMEGLVSVDGLITDMLGSAYLTGLSISEVVTDDKTIIGFNHIPAHFLTFNDSVNYPKLWTQENPTGATINREKMISHYLHTGGDPARGWLGHAIGWLYVLKRSTMDARLQFQRKYGKGFLLVNMPGDRDTYEKAWETAEELISNYSNVDGAVFPGGVEVESIDAAGVSGDYFMTTEDSFKGSIVKIILGQESTSDSESSNRSTADVHMEVLEQRIIDDAKAIEGTVNAQLIPMVKALLGIREESECIFTFKVGELEATLDEDLEEEEAVEDDQPIVEEDIDV